MPDFTSPTFWIALSLGLILGALFSVPAIVRRYRAGYRAGMHAARQVVLLSADPRSAQLSSAHVACDDLRTQIASSLLPLPSASPSIVPIHRRRGA